MTWVQSWHSIFFVFTLAGTENKNTTRCLCYECCRVNTPNKRWKLRFWNQELPCDKIFKIFFPARMYAEDHNSKSFMLDSSTHSFHVTHSCTACTQTWLRNYSPLTFMQKAIQNWIVHKWCRGLGYANHNSWRFTHNRCFAVCTRAPSITLYQ